MDDLKSFYIRPLQPDDFQQLKEAHSILFPVDYEDSFFYKACRNMSNIFSIAFFSEPEKRNLIAFVTARVFLTENVEMSDRVRMGLNDVKYNKMRIAYILTIGVLPHHQKKGLGSYLTQELEREAIKLNVQVLYLHVITYNKAAIKLYKKYDYKYKALIKDFYNISTGRQPDVNKVKWDAYFFMKWTNVHDNSIYDNIYLSSKFKNLIHPYYGENKEKKDSIELDQCSDDICFFNSWKLCWPFNISSSSSLASNYVFCSSTGKTYPSIFDKLFNRYFPIKSAESQH